MKPRQRLLITSLGATLGLVLAVVLLSAANSIFQSSGVPTPGADGTVLSADSASPLGMHWVSAPGGGDALTANPLSQFAATTSAQFAGVISDEVGTGKVLLADCAALSVKGNATNSTASVSCIAGTDGQVLRVSGTTLGFGTIATAGIADNAVTLAKLATQSAFTLLANITAGPAVPTASSLSAVLDATGGTTEHDLLIRNASAWTVAALLNCPDSGGNHLNYTAVSHSFSCGTSGGGGGGVTVTGTPTTGHVATWASTTSIQDGGVLPSFTPTGGIDEMIYYQGSGDAAFHPVTLSSGHTLTSGALGHSTLTLPTGGGVRTSTSAGNTLLLQAYDVDGATYTTFGTLTANNSPSFDLAAGVTLNGVAIANASNSMTFTNKTYDTEGTGNVFTIPMLYQFTAGNCQNATASIAFDLPTTLGATATCQGAAAGGHAAMGTAKFVNSEVDEVQGHFKLPADWTARPCN